MLPPDLPPTPDVPDSDEASLFVLAKRCSTHCDVKSLDAKQVKLQVAPPEDVAPIPQRFMASSPDPSSAPLPERMDDPAMDAASVHGQLVDDLAVEERISLEFSSASHAEENRVSPPPESIEEDGVLGGWTPEPLVSGDHMPPRIRELLQESRRIVQTDRVADMGDSASVRGAIAPLDTDQAPELQTMEADVPVDLMSEEAIQFLAVDPVDGDGREPRVAQTTLPTVELEPGVFPAPIMVPGESVPGEIVPEEGIGNDAIPEPETMPSPGERVPDIDPTFDVENDPESAPGRDERLDAVDENPFNLDALEEMFADPGADADTDADADILDDAGLDSGVDLLDANTPEEDLLELPEEDAVDGLETLPEVEDATELDSLGQARSPANPEFTVFPVGLNVGRRPVSLATPIVGAEDGRQAVDFENWLIPYSDVLDALRIRVTPLEGGQLELRSPGFVTVLNPDELRNDPRLGLTFSIQELSDRFDVEAEFDINEYAIQLFPAWLGLREAGVAQPDRPIVVDGLPVVAGPDVSVTQIEQRFDFSTRGGMERYPGNFAAVGTLLDGSWYLSLDQEDMGDASTWQLDELEYLRQSDPLDITMGSQAAFWDSSSFADHWGITAVGRNGFTPSRLLQGGSDVRQRLESNQVGRTIAGEADPGSLVRLTEGFGNRVIAEDYVDSSGIYRFDNIQFSTESLARNYRVLVFPDGRLTAAPDIREVTFSSVGGQIPAGTTAWAASVGWDRNPDDGFLDGFEDLQGGGTVRFGVNESLTLGGGMVYDNGLRGLAEVFFQPGDIPLQVAVSGLTGDDDGDWDLDANVRFDPTPDFSARFVADELENRLDLDWEFLPGLTAIGVVRSDDPDEAGLQLSLVGRDRFTFARTTVDTEGQVRWNGIQRLGKAELTTRGDDISTFSEANYNISGDRFFDSGHLAFVNHETRDRDGSDGHLTGLGWRYRSDRRSSDGNATWEAEVGLGLGSEGVGPFASVQTAIVPGFLLRARYETVSVTSDDSAFRLELVSSLNTQQRLRPGDRRTDFLRNQGGLLLEPFFDRNSNGEYDRGEERYTDNVDLLMMLNNESIRNLRPEVNRQQVLVRLEPGTYRLDLDPAGYPLDWQPQTESYALNVKPGSYTIVELPLIPAYTLAGIVVDDNGNVVSGARVEAISESGDRRFSVTNDAGVYFLERLQQGNYSLQVNQAQVLPNGIQLDPSSEPFQELNLNVPSIIPETSEIQLQI